MPKRTQHERFLASQKSRKERRSRVKGAPSQPSQRRPTLTLNYEEAETRALSQLHGDGNLIIQTPDGVRLSEGTYVQVTGANGMNGFYRVGDAGAWRSMTGITLSPVVIDSLAHVENSTSQECHCSGCVPRIWQHVAHSLGDPNPYFTCPDLGQVYSSTHPQKWLWSPNERLRGMGYTDFTGTRAEVMEWAELTMINMGQFPAPLPLTVWDCLLDD